MTRKSYVAILLLTALVSIAPKSFAETFKNPVRIATAADPEGLTVVDLNHDGLPDILWGGLGSSLSGPGVLNTLIAQPSGGFVAGPSMTMPSGVSNLCLTGDETGDGIPDIVCVGGSSTAANVNMFPGNGDGSFGSPVTTSLPNPYPNNPNPAVLVVLADFNGDKIPDLLVTNTYFENTYVMLGDGHGGFTAGPTLGYLDALGPVQVMDINGDGFADLLFSNGEVWLGKGNGSFTQAPATLSADDACVFHDMDGDGKLDAVCGTELAVDGDITGGTQLAIYKGNGDGTFNPTAIQTIDYGDQTNEYNGFGTFQAPIAVLDANGDGIPDILGRGGDGFTVILGQGNLNFAYPTHYATGYPSTTYIAEQQYTLQIADLNGDGYPDVANIGPNGIYLSYNQKDGTLAAAPAYEVTQEIGYQTVADFNEDGIPDIAATGDTGIELNLGKGDGSFQPRTALPAGDINFSTPPSATNAHILHGDFNGDHHQDILAIGSSSIYQYNSYILFGDGTGSFSAPLLVANSSETYPAYDTRVAVDLNGDGKTDLFSNDYSNLYTALSNGDGTFTSLTTTVSPNSGQNQDGVHSTAALADFDNDGKVDAVWAAGSNITLSKGNGDGTFASNAITIPIPTTLSANWTYAAVAAGDFDGDGNQDIALLLDFNPSLTTASGYADSIVYVFYGDGKDDFTAGTLVGEYYPSYEQIYAADLNNQGLSDLVLKTSGSLGGGYAVGVVDSLPGRTFNAGSSYYAGTGLADISIADLNQDGFLDLVFSNGDYNLRASSVTVLINQGNPAVTGTLTVTPEPSQYGQAITLNAAYTPSSFTQVTGTVTFAVDGTAIGTAAIANNQATFSPSTPLLPGTHTITATWPGNAAYQAVTLTATAQADQESSAISLTSSLNPASSGTSVTFTASISVANQLTDTSGTVTFFDGQTQLGAPVSAVPGTPVSFTTSSLSVGSHSITAVYSGNSQYLGSTSTALTESIQNVAGDFSLQSTPTSSTVSAGQAASFQLTVTPSGSFQSPIAFSCSGLPSGATCSFSPATLSSGQGSSTLTIQTVSSTQAQQRGFPALPTGGTVAALAGIACLFLPSASRRRRWTCLLPLLLICASALTVLGCGGGSSSGSGSGSTNPVTYQVTVTAQSSGAQTISHATTISLTVQ